MWQTNKKLGLGCDSQPCSAGHPYNAFVLCGFNQLTLIVFKKLGQPCWKITAVPFRLVLVTISHKDLAKIACSEYFRPVSISDYFRPAIDDVGLHKICIWPSFCTQIWREMSLGKYLYDEKSILGWFEQPGQSCEKKVWGRLLAVFEACFFLSFKISLKLVVCKQCCCSSWMSNAL